MTEDKINPKDIVSKALIKHTAFEQAVEQITQYYEDGKDAQEATCVALIGESRTGKSRVLETIQKQYPEVRTEAGLTMPILYAITPGNPTSKALFEKLLQVLGDPRASVGSVNEMINRLKKLLKKTQTRMIMLDEFHHFYDKGLHKVGYVVSDDLKTLVDETGIVLVVAGRPDCRAIIEQNEQMTNRFLEPIVMPRFDWANDEHREEFIGILDAYTDTLRPYLDIVDLASEEMAFRMYCSCGGLIGLLSKLIRLATANAVNGGSNTIDLAMLADAYKKSIWKVKKVIDSGVTNPFEQNTLLPTSHSVQTAQLLGERVLQPFPARKSKSRSGKVQSTAI